MTWLLCGVSLVKWKSDTSELFYFRRRKGKQVNPSFWQIWLLMDVVLLVIICFHVRNVNNSFLFLI